LLVYENHVRCAGVGYRLLFFVLAVSGKLLNVYILQHFSGFKIEKGLK